MVFLLIGCKGVTEISDDTNQFTESLLVEDTSTFEFEGHKSSAWVSDNFKGSHSRLISDDVLRFTVSQSTDEGGLDVGLSKLNAFAGSVSGVADNASFWSSYEIDLIGAGRWWAGPKTSVNLQGDESAKQNGDDRHKNYIVEISSSFPEDLHDIFTGDSFSSDDLPYTVLAGSIYRNYNIRFPDWWQFSPVRPDYRETGTVPIKPILKLCAENGLPTDR